MSVLARGIASGLVQVLKIPFDSSKIATAGSVEMKIETDHPDQGLVVVSLLIHPSAPGGRR